MGIENRDYIREGASRGSSFGSQHPTCFWILVVTIAVYVLQIVTLPPTERSGRFAGPERQSLVNEWLQMDTDKVLHGQVWRLLTVALCHDVYSVYHIVINMLIFYWFGRRLEDRYGSREFMLFYWSAALFASAIYLIVELMTGDRHMGIGASGAVFAVFGLYAMHYPYERILFMFIIPIQIRFLFLLYVLFDLHPLLLQLTGHDVFSGVAHAAHLGGAQFGYMYFKRRWSLQLFEERISAPFRRAQVQRRAARRGLRVVHPEANEPTSSPIDTEEIDAILQKISESGIDSLNAEERRILEQASEKLRSHRGN